MAKKSFYQRGATKPKPKTGEKFEHDINEVIFDYGPTQNGGSKHDNEKTKKNIITLALYFGETLDKGGRQAQKALEEGKAPTFVKPADPAPIKKKVKVLDKDGKETGREKEVDTNEFNALEMRKWELNLKKYEADQELWDENNNKVFSVISQRCTGEMLTHLDTLKEYRVAKENQDGIALSLVLLSVSRHESVQVDQTMATVQAAKRTYQFWQKSDGVERSMGHYLKSLKSHVESAKALGVKIDENDVLYEHYCKTHSVDKSDTDAVTAAKAAVAQEILACMFIEGLDNAQYGEHKRELHNRCSNGVDAYPKTLDAALRYISTYVPSKRTSAGGGKEQGSGLVMVNAGAAGKKKKLQAEMKALQDKAKKAATDAAAKDAKGEKAEIVKKAGEIKCFNGCGGNHKAYDCPYLTKEEKEKLKQVRLGIKQIDGQINANVEDEDAFDYGDREEEDGTMITMIGGEVDVVSSRGVMNANVRQALCAYKLYLDTMGSHHQLHSEEYAPEGPYESDTVMKSSCNAGVTTMNEKLRIGNIEFWYGRNGIANILSVPQLERDGYNLTYTTGGTWVVVTPDGKTIDFKRESGGVTDGMHYIDIREEIDGITHVNAQIPTVKDKIEGYTKKEVEQAHLARRMLATMAYPSERDFQNMVSKRMIQNCPISLSDIARANEIFGPDVATLRGKTVRPKSKRVELPPSRVPRAFYLQHRIVQLVGDIMYCNGNPFLITLSRKIRLLTAEVVASRTTKCLGRALNSVIKRYARYGFEVRVILMDVEFEKVKDTCLVDIECVAPREHVGEIERAIRLIQERARCLTSVLPFKILHHWIIVRAVEFAVWWLNALPSTQGISQEYSPRTIVTGQEIDFKKYCQYLFGEYVEAADIRTITNDNKPRTRPGIALGPTGNASGTYYVFCIETGKLLARHVLKSISMSDEIIRRMEEWGRKSKRNNGGKKLAFLNRLKEKYDWDTDAEVDVEELPSDVERHSHTPAELPGIDLERYHENETPEEEWTVIPGSLPQREHEQNTSLTPTRAQTTGVDHNRNNYYESIAITDDEEDDTENDDDDDNSAEAEEEAMVEVEITGVNNIQDTEANTDEAEDWFDPQPEVEEDDEDTGNIAQEVERQALRQTLQTRTAAMADVRRSTRTRQNPSPYVPSMTGKRYADGVINVNTAKMEVEPMTEEDKDEHILGMILAQQFMMHVGLKKFGDRGEKAVTKELTQLHDLVAFLPVKADELSDEEWKEALAALMFLTEKRDGTVKGRGVANGSKQRAYIPKEDATSPTATIEGIFITSAIEAHEGRDVATIDCPGAFLSALSDEHVHMVLKGKMAELMVLVDPVLYRKYVTMENGKPALYVKVNKALYGLLRSALLFYKKLVKDLEGYGFKVSDYDPCVATKETATGQMTVTWHVDDLKVSHKDPFEITMFAEYLAGIYGDKLTVHRGKIHDYLGMDLDFSKKGAVRVSMIKYLHKILEGFPEAISGTAATPAGENLFKVRDETDRKLLPEEQAQHFHRTVAQLLFLSCRARRDIQTAVAFLTTRVKEPDEDDWKKLIRVLKYLNGTKYMKLTLTVDSLNIIRWWVDSSYMTHEDCKGHNGGMMTLGRGAVVSMSGKQKLNVRSSTECELVGAYDVLPTILWCKYFIESLGYEVEHNILMQDNKSAILLEKNGRMSSSKRTKHIRARYFLIKDKVDQGDLEIKYCPTDDMWADINTKPLQGSKFYRMRAVLMNVPVDYDDEEEMLSTPMELLPDRSKVLKKEVLDALELMMSNGE